MNTKQFFETQSLEAVKTRLKGKPFEGEYDANDAFVGAYRAAYQGRPEVIQYLFANENLEQHRLSQVLAAFIQADRKIKETVDLVTATMTDDARQDLLYRTLHYIAHGMGGINYFTSHATAVMTPLAAGAKVSDGILAGVATLGLPENTVKAVYDAGAKFEDAVFYAQMHPKLADVNAVQAYQHKITGTVTAPYGSVDAVLQQQVAELQEAVRELTEKKPSRAAAKPSATAKTTGPTR